MTSNQPSNDPNANNPASPQPSASKPARNRRPLVIGVIVATVALVGAAAAFLILKPASQRHDAYDQSKLTGDQKKLIAQDDAFAQQYLRGCRSDRKVSFTQAPIALSQLGYIEPMGKMYDGHVTPTDHVYVVPVNQQAADNTTDVVMPADGTVINVSAMPAQYIGDRAQQTAPEDHRLVIAHDCQYVSIFIHVHQLSGPLKAALGATLAPNSQKDIAVELKAGDKLGKIGGNPVDWSLMDANKKLAGFITPDLYKGEPWKIHVIDPISLFSGEVKNQLIAKSLRTAEPFGGKIDYDLTGKLRGNWFREGTNGYMGADQNRYYDGHLSIVPDHLDSAHIIVSLGNWDGKAAQFAVKGNVDPAGIGQNSGPLKYELSGIEYNFANGQPWTGGSLTKGMIISQAGATKGTILLQVLSSEKLKVETFPGKTPGQVSGFTSAAKTFVR